MFKALKKSKAPLSQAEAHIAKIESRFDIYIQTNKRYGGLVEAVEYPQASMYVKGDDLKSFLYDSTIDFYTKLENLKFSKTTQRGRPILYYNSPNFHIKLKNNEDGIAAGKVFSTAIIYKRNTCELEIDDLLKGILIHNEASKHMDRKIQFPDCQVGMPPEYEHIISREDFLKYLLYKTSLKKKIKFNSSKEVVRVKSLNPQLDEQLVYLYKNPREPAEDALGCMLDCVILTKLHDEYFERIYEEQVRADDEARAAFEAQLEAAARLREEAEETTQTPKQIEDTEQPKAKL